MKKNNFEPKLAVVNKEINIWIPNDKTEIVIFRGQEMFKISLPLKVNK